MAIIEHYVLPCNIMVKKGGRQNFKMTELETWILDLTEKWIWHVFYSAKLKKIQWFILSHHLETTGEQTDRHLSRGYHIIPHLSMKWGMKIGSRFQIKFHELLIIGYVSFVTRLRGFVRMGPSLPCKRMEICH